MDPARTTCWTIVRGAAAGEASARDEFSRRYLPVVRAYLRRRWSGTSWLDEVDDAVQELFLECFKEDGALERLDPERAGGFRAYLYGVARNIAWRVERREARRRERASPDGGVERVVADEATLSQVFDRAWALALVRAAIVKLGDREGAGGEGAKRHAELLRLRFSEGLPVREIARRWSTDPALVHRAYATARGEFKRCLFDVVEEHYPDTEGPGRKGEIERKCAELLTLLA